MSQIKNDNDILSNLGSRFYIMWGYSKKVAVGLNTASEPGAGTLVPVYRGEYLCFMMSIKAEVCHICTNLHLWKKNSQESMLMSYRSKGLKVLILDLQEIK